MDDDLREQVERESEKHALFNALKHGGDPDVGAIMGPLMGENPSFRPHGDAIPGVIAGVVAEITSLDESERRARLEDIAPDRIAELDADDHTDDHTLPDLPKADQYDEVVMRVAPNPNGPWHLGHARMPSVIGTYADRYDGRFILRYDDTDPETKRPDLEAYDAIVEDLEYLGYQPSEILRASDRLETYYEHARQLIDAGGAYTCSCPAGEFSQLKSDSEACPHRDKSQSTVHEEFEAMVAGEYDSSEMVLRVQTDITHKNPALRDWVGFRIIDSPHPRPEAAEYRCWPMLDFQSGIDDHLTGVTHIIRGIDLQDSAKRQRFVYDYFEWEYPEVLHWGNVQIDAYDVAMSTSTINEQIESGELTGWEDPRAPTLRSVRRRGIRGDAIVEAMTELGMSTSDVDLAMSSVYSHNRNRIDADATRYFLVRDRPNNPLRELAIKGGPDAGHPPRHPDDPDRGDRTITAGRVMLEESDLPPEGSTVWLKGYGPVCHTDGNLQFTDDDLSVVKEGDVSVVHWVSAAESRRVRMRTPDGDVIGRAEAEFAETAVDDVVQFERVGFCRVDSHEPIATADKSGHADEDHSVVYFAHS